MSVTQTTVKNTYSADGSTRSWEYTFPVLKGENVCIIVTDAEGEEKEITTGFSINPLTQTVTYPTLESGLSPLQTGEKITLCRDTPKTQDMDLMRQGTLDAEELETAFDKLTMIAQETAADLERAVKFPVSDSGGETDAQAYLDDIHAGVDTATAQAQSAQSAAAQAQTSAQTAAAKADLAAYEADRADNYSSAASSSMAQAQAAATQALQSATQAAAQAQNAQASAAGAASSAEEAEDVLEEIKRRRGKTYTFTAGTPHEEYSGSLNTFNLGQDLTDLAVVPYVNGQRKDEGEYSVSDTSVIFAYDLKTGDRVVFDVQGDVVSWGSDAEENSAVVAHNEDTTAHADIRTKIGTDIAAHNTSASAHADIRSKISTDISAHDQNTAAHADIRSAISNQIAAHNAAQDAHADLEERIAALEEGGSGGSAEEWKTWTGDYYTASQLSTGLSSGKSSATALGVLAGKTITKIEAWAGNGTEGNPYFRLPWSYGWHISGNFLTLYYNRPGLDMDLSSYYTNSSAINVVTRVYYK